MSENENKRLEALEEKTDKILAALIGNEYSKNGGLVEDIRDMKKVTIPSILSRLEKLESLKNRLVWMAMGAGLPVGAAVLKIIQWIQEAAQR